MKALIIECQKLGMNTNNADFAFDIAWVQQFVQAAVDNRTTSQMTSAVLQERREHHLAENSTKNMSF